MHAGSWGCLTWTRLQQPQEQCYPFLTVRVVFLTVQTKVWLPVLGTFNVRTDVVVNACDCTQGLCRHHKRVCAESWLWEKNLLLNWGVEPTSATFASLTHYQLSYIPALIEVMWLLTVLRWCLHFPMKLCCGCWLYSVVLTLPCEVMRLLTVFQWCWSLPMKSRRQVGESSKLRSGCRSYFSGADTYLWSDVVVADCVSVVLKPPYEVTETGWGEFEVIIKIYFTDPNERPVSLRWPQLLPPPRPFSWLFRSSFATTTLLQCTLSDC